MEILTSHTPQYSAAKALSEALAKHKNTKILLLLAGGSSLQILEELDTTHINEYVTIMMMDERFSTDPTENNFLQMTKTLFYTKLTNSQCNFIPSVPNKNETHSNFSNRIAEDLQAYLDAHPQGTVIALFGAGSDGHTAAIFPMEQKLFIDTYGQGNLYTKVTYNNNPFPNRSSITPKFINNYITESYLYATGEEKLPILSTITDPYELHEMPAHIHHQIDSTLFTNLPLT
jgi:6-phosphogluconolactonase/glucosamine-6-phosphate isomerase/deaminase